MTRITTFVLGLGAVALSGCFSVYEPQQGMASEESKQRIDARLAERTARDQAAAEAAKAAHAKLVDDYLAGPGAGRPDRIKQAVRDGKVAFGMKHAEVELVMGGVGTRAVSSTAEEVKSVWTGVTAGGPLLAAERSKGHAGPLTVKFTDGIVTAVESDEAK